MKVKSIEDLYAGKFTEGKTYKGEDGRYFQVIDFGEFVVGHYELYMSPEGSWKDDYQYNPNDGVDEETWWEKKKEELDAMDPYDNDIFMDDYMSFIYTNSDYGQFFLTIYV